MDDSITTPRNELSQHFPAVLSEAKTIDYDALAAQIGTVTSAYHLPTSPEGDRGPWLDKLELCQDVARHIRDGGSIDLDAVVIER